MKLFFLIFALNFGSSLNESLEGDAFGYSEDYVSNLIGDLMDKDDISGLGLINWNKVITPNGQTQVGDQQNQSSVSRQQAPVFIIPIIAAFKSLAAKALILKSGALATKAFIALKGMFTMKTATAIGSKVLISLVAAKVGQVTEKLLTKWFSAKVEERTAQIMKDWDQLKEKEKDGLISEVRNAINKTGGESSVTDEERKQLASGLINGKLNELRKKFAESVVDKIMLDLDEENFLKEILNDNEIKKGIVDRII